MVIHNLQTEFRLLVAIIHTKDSKNIYICAHIGRLHREISMHVCLCTIVAFGFVRFPIFSYTLYAAAQHI